MTKETTQLLRILCEMMGVVLIAVGTTIIVSGSVVTGVFCICGGIGFLGLSEVYEEQ